MDYTGKICDGCRQPFEKGDDIVVCPECGTPQHRSCYEKNHCCVNEYLHSPDFSWTEPEDEKKEENVEPQSSAVQPEPQQPLTVSATPDSMESVFMRGVLYDPKDDIGGATVGETADYIQNSAPRYVSKFMKQKKEKSKLTWNWAAFFFAPYWFFYRKLYKAGAVFLALSVALSLATSSYAEKAFDLYEQFGTASKEIVEIEKSDKADSEENVKKINGLNAEMQKIAKQLTPRLLIMVTINFIIPNLIAALLANFLLKKKMLRVISLARSSSDKPDVIKYTIMRSGGVSVFMPILAIMVNNYLPTLLLNIAYSIK